MEETCKACERERFRKENPKAMMNLLAYAHTCEKYLENKWEDACKRGIHSARIEGDIPEDAKCDFCDIIIRKSDS